MTDRHDDHAGLPPASSGGLPRRWLLGAGAGLGVGLLPGVPRAQGTSQGVGQGAPELKGHTVVFASYGGSYQDAEKRCYCEPFERATGASVVQDGPVNPAKFRAMMAAGTPDWDVVDVTIDFLFNTEREGFFEPIDAALVDTARVAPAYRDAHGVGCIVWSYNVCFSTTAFPAGRAPRTWADVFDLKAFPGQRTFPDDPVATLEAALMADGVAPDALYPLDVERGLRKLTTIRAQTVFWSTNSQSQQLFTDGEVVAGMMLNGRCYDAHKKGAPVGLSWEGNIRSVDYLVVPKGSKAREAAMVLIDTMTRAENQAALANLIAYSPTNPDAFASVDPALSPWLSTQPDNAAKGLLIGAAYWRENLRTNQDRWTSWKLG